MRGTASKPLDASPTTAMSPSASRILRRTIRESDESSTVTTRIVMPSPLGRLCLDVPERIEEVGDELHELGIITAACGVLGPARNRGHGAEVQHARFSGETVKLRRREAELGLLSAATSSAIRPWRCHAV